MCCRLLPCQFRAALFGALPGPCARAPGALATLNAPATRLPGPRRCARTPCPSPVPERGAAAGAKDRHRRTAPRRHSHQRRRASATCELPPIAAHSPAGAHSARSVHPPAPPQQAPRLGRMPPRRTPAAAVPTLTSRAAAARPASAVARLPMVRTPPNAAGGKRTSGRDGRGAICWSSVGHLLTTC